jgi:hypothetical protein
MVTPGTVISLVKHRMNRVLTMVEAALPESQFRALRKLILDEFGKSGLESELERVFNQQGQGQGRHGQE